MMRCYFTSDAYMQGRIHQAALVEHMNVIMKLHESFHWKWWQDMSVHWRPRRHVDIWVVPVNTVKALSN